MTELSSILLMHEIEDLKSEWMNTVTLILFSQSRSSIKSLKMFGRLSYGIYSTKKVCMLSHILL